MTAPDYTMIMGVLNGKVAPSGASLYVLLAGDSFPTSIAFSFVEIADDSYPASTYVSGQSAYIVEAASPPPAASSLPPPPLSLPPPG